MAGVKLTGTNRAVKAVAKIQRDVEKKLLRKSVTAGAKLINKVAKRKVRKQTKTLAKAIGQKVKSYKKRVVGIIGPRKGMGRQTKYGYRDPVKYAHLVELGTSHSRAYPFLRSTLDEYKASIEKAMANVIAQGLP